MAWVSLYSCLELLSVVFLLAVGIFCMRWVGFFFWEGKCVSSTLKQVLGRTDNVTEQCGKKTQPWKAHIGSRHLWDH